MNNTAAVCFERDDLEIVLVLHLNDGMSTRKFTVSNFIGSAVKVLALSDFDKEVNENGVGARRTSACHT